jgi:hypothetical protein
VDSSDDEDGQPGRAARVVAAVNFCEGVPDALLAATTLQGLTSAAGISGLLAVCQWAVAPDRPVGGDAEFVREIKRMARAAVAALKGG